jgi:hypothetical protein
MVPRFNFCFSAARGSAEYIFDVRSRAAEKQKAGVVSGGVL